MKLDGQVCNVQKYCQSSNLAVTGPNPASPHPRMWHFAKSLHKSKQSNVGMSVVSSDVYVGGKISACCLATYNITDRSSMMPQQTASKSSSKFRQQSYLNIIKEINVPLFISKRPEDVWDLAKYAVSMKTGWLNDYHTYIQAQSWWHEICYLLDCMYSSVVSSVSVSSRLIVCK